MPEQNDFKDLIAEADEVLYQACQTYQYWSVEKAFKELKQKHADLFPLIRRLKEAVESKLGG